MSTAALLTAVASVLAGQPTPVHCTNPPEQPWPRDYQGIVVWYGGRWPHIYLRRCTETPRAVTIFAHEIIHVQYPYWPHWKVYRWDDWYGRTVVGPRIRWCRRAPRSPPCRTTRSRRQARRPAARVVPAR